MEKLKGKIILVDDARFEKQLLEAALEKQKCDVKVEYFNNIEGAIEHLKKNSDEIFLIISDIDMDTDLPNKNGIELKRVIDKDKYLSLKSIPFVFMSNVILQDRVMEAYKYHVQGYFLKPDTLDAHAKLLGTIIQYWQICIHPNKNVGPLICQIPHLS